MEELLLSRECHNEAIVCLGLVQKVIYMLYHNFQFFLLKCLLLDRLKYYTQNTSDITCLHVRQFIHM